VAHGEYRSLARVTFADYAPEWIRSYRGRTARGIGQDTLSDYRRVLGLDGDGRATGEGAVGFFGRTLLAEIGAPELRAFADHVSSRGGAAAALSRRSASCSRNEAVVRVASPLPPVRDPAWGAGLRREPWSGNQRVTVVVSVVQVETRVAPRRANARGRGTQHWRL
jgi:hypothetical protein